MLTNPFSKKFEKMLINLVETNVGRFFGVLIVSCALEDRAERVPNKLMLKW